MKIDVDILRTRNNEIVWADDNPSGHGFLVHSAGSEVSDEWLEKNGLAEPEPAPEPVPVEPKPDPKKPAAAKQTAAAANKMQSPKSDK